MKQLEELLDRKRQLELRVEATLKEDFAECLEEIINEEKLHKELTKKQWEEQMPFFTNRAVFKVRAHHQKLNYPPEMSILVNTILDGMEVKE